jgi:hypothetical protein
VARDLEEVVRSPATNIFFVINFKRLPSIWMRIRTQKRLLSSAVPVLLVLSVAGPQISHEEIALTSLLPVTSCIADSAAIYIMVVKFINTICPPPPQLLLHRRAALSTNPNGTQSVYGRKNPKSSL